MLIKNGLVAGENGTVASDIRVDGEAILEIGPSLAPREDERVIDAAGMIILPGGVDIHTHMDLDLGSVRATDDFYTGTVAAACGGTTTIVDHMAFGPKGASIRSQVEAYHGLAEGKAVIDYGFHGVFDHVDEGILAEFETLIGEGITSHKFYLTYGGKISDAEALSAMERAKETGVLLMVHAENDGAIEHLKRKCHERGETAPIGHARSRPPECEAEAVSRMAYLARMASDAPVYFVHLSSLAGLEALRFARARGQNNLYAETCPQYLLLDESLYLREDGLKYIMSPPLRTPENSDALWGAVKNGEIDAIATDHCPFFYEKDKQLGKHDFAKAPGGAPGVEARLPLMFAQIAAGRLSIGQLVSLCCANPARLAGLYPQKGAIAPGSDADLVLIDPNIERPLAFDMLHENTDYTPYEGHMLSGWPVMTIARGEIVAQNGQWLGQKGRGKFLKRKFPNLNKR